MKYLQYGDMGAKDIAKAWIQQRNLWHEVICHLLSLL